MSTNIRPFRTAQPTEACADVTKGSMLPDYLVGMLEDPAAEMVEEHLAECGHCRGRYQTILRVRAASMRARPRKRVEDEPEPFRNAGGLRLAGPKNGRR